MLNFAPLFDRLAREIDRSRTLPAMMSQQSFRSLCFLTSSNEYSFPAAIATSRDHPIEEPSPDRESFSLPSPEDRTEAVQETGDGAPCGRLQRGAGAD
jgi:hypothetical protein